MKMIVLKCEGFGVGSAGKGNGTGNVGSDTKTWLSAALSNQDTCMEGFDGTSGLIKPLVAGNESFFLLC